MTAFILYQGQKIEIPENTKIDELANALKAMQNSVAYSWVTLNLDGPDPKRVRLMVGPGIPIGIISDPLDGHEPNVTDDSLRDFMNGSE
ncbi:hypothetical protein [Paenarthrobacter ureafaciens]|jgi:hypothetical protein|uniref:hypothetical protein n=1 Tax=Paenarthrobacter ureafaciens TaxID=37931 RepID=UPI00140A281D|nr:hypothetical protein [Paenarthrobacter ureafaciens]MCX8453368.1 hypothetical protein [Paenarthrobacter ureafaciens]MCY0972949.1 hypothetical protein [Paenarthrobacter ureafaciens]